MIFQRKSIMFISLLPLFPFFAPLVGMQNEIAMEVAAHVIKKNKQDGNDVLIFVDTMHNLTRGLTFCQAFLINAFYEIVILRRLAIIRAAAQKCRAFIEDAAIVKLKKCLSGSFDRNIQKMLKAGEALLTKLSAQPMSIVTDGNRPLGIQDFVFDFRNKPQKWLLAYQTLPEPIRDVLVRYVRLAT